MAYNTGVRAAYTDTTAQKRNVEDAISIISPRAVPLLKVLVGLAENEGKPPKISTLKFKATQVKHEWLEDQLPATSDTLGAAVSDTNGTSWTATDGTKFRKGHIVQVDSEIVWVSAVSSNTLTVTRAFAGTTGATHTNGSTLEIIGIAMLDGDDAPTARSTTFSNPYNYAQLFEVPIHISGREQAVEQYGVKDSYKYQMGKAFMEACVQLERALFQGKRSANVGSSSAPSAMGGFQTFITDNVTSLSSAAITEKDLNDLLQTIFADVGSAMMPQDIFCAPWAKRKISSFYEPRRQMGTVERVAGITVDKIQTDFGDFNVHLSYWCPAGTLFVVNLDNVGVGPLEGRGFFEEKLAKSGDYVKGHVVGDYTAEIRSDKSHGMLTNISTTT